MIKLLSLPIILIGLIIIYRSIKKQIVVPIEEIELSELSKIWVDELPQKIKEEVSVVDTKSTEVSKVDYDEDTGELLFKAPDLLEKFFKKLVDIINVVVDGRCGVFTLFDSDNVYISQKTLLALADSFSVTEDNIIKELQREGYCDSNSSYKLYKVYFKNSNKPLVYKNLNIKLFCVESIEQRKGKNFVITNIEEVKAG